MSKKTWIVIGVIALALVVLRMLLPTIVLDVVNTQLSQMKEYTGQVEDIDIALIRGAYVIDGIEIVKRETEDRDVSDSIPFFSSPRVDLSVEWKALFKGKIVGELELDRPKLNFVNPPKKDNEAKQDTADFRELIRDLMPLSINRFQINDAEIHYIDNMTEARVDVFAENLNVLATGLTNKPEGNDTLPSSIKADANVYGGAFDLKVRLDALAENPTFDMEAEMKELDLTNLNDFMRAYGNFDVEEGEFNVYTEFAAKNGEFGGYVKPLIKKLNVVEWKTEEGTTAQKIWESIVEGAAELFENQKNDQIGSKIMIENTFQDPKVRIGPAIGLVLRNAFIQALRPSIEQSIDLDDLEPKENGFFKELFEKNNKSDDKKQAGLVPTNSNPELV